MSENNSEVARTLKLIEQEYNSAMAALKGPAQGVCQHSFITARMENMGKLQTQLDELIGDHDQVMMLVITTMDGFPPQENP